MKKTISLIVTAAAVLSLLSACTGKTGGDTTETQSTTAPITDSAAESTAASTANTSRDAITLKISAESFADENGEKTFCDSLDNIGGIKYVKDDETKLYTLEMSAETHKKLLEMKKKEALAGFDKCIEDSTNYISDIEYDEDFRTVSIFAEREKYTDVSSGLDMTAVTAASYALLYQLYTVDGQKTNVKVLFSDTKEEISSFTLPLTIG